jgi:hypothetical protein
MAIREFIERKQSRRRKVRDPIPSAPLLLYARCDFRHLSFRSSVAARRLCIPRVGRGLHRSSANMPLRNVPAPPRSPKTTKRRTSQVIQPRLWRHVRVELQDEPREVGNRSGRTGRFGGYQSVSLFRLSRSLSKLEEASEGQISSQTQ